MLALFRNPLLRLLGRLWWLPALTLVAAWGLGGERGLRMAGLGVTAYLAAVAGIIGPAWAHGAYAASRERASHRSSQHRFLCPECLHFGDFDFACGACGKKVEAFLVHTSGAYINDCPHCHERLLSRDGLDGRGVRAYCERCKGNSDRAVHHQREVHVQATLLPTDFTSLCQTIGAQEKQAQGGVGHACNDDGERLTHLLNLSTLTDAASSLPGTHALWELKSVWLDAAGDDTEAALKVGEAADRFDRQTTTDEQKGPDEQRGFVKKLIVCVPQTEPGNAVKNVLETRFKAVRHGVAAETYLYGKGWYSDEPSSPRPTLPLPTATPQANSQRKPKPLEQQRGRE